MNYLKLQQDLIKELVNEPKKKQFIRIGRIDGNVAILTEYSTFIVPSDKFLLDYEKIKNKLMEMGEHTIRNFIPNDLVDVVKTNDIKVIAGQRLNSKPVHCNKYLIDNKTPLYVNEKLMKYFDGENEYKGTNDKAPLFIYEYDELVGFVLPVHVPKEEKECTE